MLWWKFDAPLRHALVEGGGSKLSFGDDNSKIGLRLDLTTMAHGNHQLLLEGFA
jgi:hypothetical protein